MDGVCKGQLQRGTLTRARGCKGISVAQNHGNARLPRG